MNTVSSAITVTTNEKPKEMKRCKFYPSCTRGDRCEYVHPSTPCKSFPNCKYGEHCLYIHPKCKFDLTCSRLDCNFSHTPVASAAPPLGTYFIGGYWYFLPNFSRVIQQISLILMNFYCVLFVSIQPHTLCLLQIIRKSLLHHYRLYAVSIQIVRTHYANFIIQSHANSAKIAPTKWSATFTISICQCRMPYNRYAIGWSGLHRLHEFRFADTRCWSFVFFPLGLADSCMF